MYSWELIIHKVIKKSSYLINPQIERHTNTSPTPPAGRETQRMIHSFNLIAISNLIVIEHYAIYPISMITE